MKTFSINSCAVAISALWSLFAFSALAEFKMDRSVMSDAYWRIWNDDAQKKIDADIVGQKGQDPSM